MSTPYSMSAVGEALRFFLGDPPFPPWHSGPQVSTGEQSVYAVDMPTFLAWVDEVEQDAGSTEEAVQRLRRLYYSAPLGKAGRFFDLVIDTDQTNLALAPHVTQGTLDGLVRTGIVEVAPGQLVDISHVFVLLDLKLNGRGDAGMLYDCGLGVTANLARTLNLTAELPGGTSLDALLSWQGDLASAWIAVNDWRLKQKAAKGDAWTEPVDRAALEAGPFEQLTKNAIPGRSSLEDLLGDLDAVVLSSNFESSSIAALLQDYYTPQIGSDPTAVNVINRFPLFMAAANPGLPASRDPTGPWQLGEDTLVALTSVVVSGAVTLLIAAGRLPPSILRDVLWSPWGMPVAAQIASRFRSFLLRRLNGEPWTAADWPSWPPKAIPFAGYDLWLDDPPTAAQLAAVTQFYRNMDDPWQSLPHTEDSRGGPTGHSPGPALPRFSAVDFRDPRGESAVVVPGASGGLTRVQLSGFRPLAQVTPPANDTPATVHRDLLEIDPGVARGTYKIRAVNPTARTVDIEGLRPGFTELGWWRIRLRPQLVLIDSIGGRVAGKRVKLVSEATPVSKLELDVEPDLRDINVNLDTIFLAADDATRYNPRARASRTYRIVGLDPIRCTVDIATTVAEEPSLPPSGSRWRIPAGIGGENVGTADRFVPSTKGTDHYDAALFVICDQQFLGVPLPFTSYSSVMSPKDNLASVRGNARYILVSAKSVEKAWINFAFEVLTLGPTGNLTGSLDARFYFDAVSSAGTNPPPDKRDIAVRTAKKSQIMVHYGRPSRVPLPPAPSTGGMGCQVSPEFYRLRQILIEHQQAERALLGQPAAPALTILAADLDHESNQRRYSQLAPPGTAVPPPIAAPDWDHWVGAILWVVRPEERPPA